MKALTTLGRAFPAGLGAKCAVPDRLVICFTGDGGFWYYLSELETARRHYLNTVTINNSNGGLGQGIKDGQTVYGDRPGNPAELYRFESVNFARLAQEKGCNGLRVEQPEQIGEAIQQALTADMPTVIEVLTGLHHRPSAPWSPHR